ncbi:hypothetical protein AB6A40_002627 [Gnathostoma spinigerum]|uniref:alpha-1,2-Mannosidase n=1 Tax=Gnathostoma spinigerum TaxID=75299 RepID=A0ABD6E789_9BILA
MIYWFHLFVLCIAVHWNACDAVKFSQKKMEFYREKVRKMFYHAYNGYLNYAYPLDELKPLTCSGMDTWGSFSLTLIDALDTLLVLGNETEFKRASDIVLKTVKVNSNVNVSVFETNIRVIGGLLSAHLFSGRVEGMQLEEGWPCSGPLLRLAERFAQRLLPAFNTYTGMPYGTVNLRYGVHRQETPITCTAGVGTVILEFGTLSRLTGNPHYERVAMKALDALWKSRSKLGLVGNHIDVNTGTWTATDAGIGAGVDSYYEYLAKGALMFHKPALMEQFNAYVKAINKYIRRGDWFVWVSMQKAQVSLPVFQSLESFWPGILALTGNVDDARRILLQYSTVVSRYGFPPEFFNIPNEEAVSHRSGYPLRPEFVESIYYLYRATQDPYLLQLAAGVVEAIEHSCLTSCGYATVRSVEDHTIEDRMESFFLSETTKYLYLIFDPENFLNTDGTEAMAIETPDGPCVINGGGYVFNTEAHPLDPGAIYCCSAERKSDKELIYNFEDNINFLELLNTPNDGAEQSWMYSVKPEMIANHKSNELSNSKKENFLERNGFVRKDVDKSTAASGLNDKKTLLFNFGELEELLRVKDSASTQLLKAYVEDSVKPLLEEENRFGESDTHAFLKLLRQLATFKHDLSRFGKTLRSVDSVRSSLQVQSSTSQWPTLLVYCKDCCHLHDWNASSTIFRYFLTLIYQNYLYVSRNVPVVIGPGCLSEEEISWTYINIPPEVPKLDSADSVPHIDRISFSEFRYWPVPDVDYSLLTTPPQSFLSRFMGETQVLPMNLTVA